MKKTVLTLCLLGLLGTSMMSFATVAKENIQLSRINSVLNSVYPMIAAAKAQAVPTEQVKFQYQKLIADLQAVQAGIAQKVNSAPIEPRVVKALDTHFVTKEG